MNNIDEIKLWIDKPFEVFHSDSFPQDTNPMTYFALTDALIQYSGEYEQPIIYFWPTDKTIFLGMVDTKLPFLHSALPIFPSNDYEYIVRNSGGLAVVSDRGVLNFSMVFPEPRNRLTIDQAYDRMHQLISEVLRPYGVTVDAYEIPDSYCPGDYDLSINGRKIAGISQRRISGGISVMIYLSVNGDQQQRAEMVRDFYDAGLQGSETHWDYPDVNPSVMTTIEEEINQKISVDDVIEKIMSLIKYTQSTESMKSGEYNNYIKEAYKYSYEKMLKRNNKLLGGSFNRKEE